MAKNLKENMKKLIIISSFLTFGIVNVVYCSPNNTINIPNSFSPGTVIQSSQTNANNNEIQSKFNAHTHNDITQTGTITSGAWNGTAVSTQYGGTGKDLSAATQGSVPYFNGTGTVTTLPTGTSSYVLTSNGAGANVSWTAVAGARDAIVRGFEVSASTVHGEVLVNSGVLFVGSTIVDSATNATLTLSTASDWTSGSTVDFSGGAGWCNIGVNSNGLIKFTGTGKLDSSNTTGSTDGTKLYSWDGTQYWRIVGSTYVSTVNKNTYTLFQRNKIMMLDKPSTVTTSAAPAAWNTVDCSAVIPPISTFGIFGIKAQRAGGDTALAIRPNGSDMPYAVVDGVGGGPTSDGTGGQKICCTDSTQQIQYYHTTADTIAITVEGYYLDIR